MLQKTTTTTNELFGQPNTSLLSEFSEKICCEVYCKLDFQHAMFRIHKKKTIEEKRVYMQL